MLGLAWRRRDYNIAPYSLLLSTAGAILAAYHTYLQFGGNPFISCGAATEAVACAQRFVFEFGFITIPVMTLTAFGLMILLMSAVVLDKKRGGVCKT